MIRAEFLFFGLSLWAMTGRSPNRYIAQGNTLGVSQLSNLRSERAAGVSSLQFSPFLLLFQSAEQLSHSSPGCYPGLYSHWAFSPSLPITMTAAQSSVLYSCWSFAPCFHLTTVSTQSSDLYYFWVLSPSFLVTLVAAKSSVLYSCWGFASPFANNHGCCSIL